jgi:DNA-binding MarR family transcriptional regulator
LSAEDSAVGAGRDLHELGLEARVHRDDHATLKLWLRLLACTTQIEAEIRSRLRQEFGVTLARFDYLAQLFRHPDGLKMRDLSRQLMVTGGNVTGLTDELEREGMVRRESSPTDRRSWIISLTPEGRESFARMAQAHEQWLKDMFAGLPPESIRLLHEQVGQLRAQLRLSGEIISKPPNHNDKAATPP